MSLCQIALAASRKTLFGVPLMLTMPLIAQASPIWSTGTPANAYMATPTPASPNFGGTLINFDSLPTSCGFPPSGCTNYSGTTFSGVTITSPDALNVIPYSSQSAPNELFDDSAGGSANITITTASGESAFGVGIADSDPVTITLQALGLGGVPFGSPDTITIPETGSNPGNGYYYVTDTTADIYGIQITQSLSDTVNYSGLAIDDVQAATPLPAALPLFASGLGAIGLFGWRRKRKAAAIAV